MEATEISSLLESAASFGKDEPFFPAGKALAAALYEGLFLVLTRETLRRMCKDEWLLSSTWRVAPGRTAYKLINSSPSPVSPVYVERWQLAQGGALELPGEDARGAADHPLGLKAARQLVVFDEDVLFELLGLAHHAKRLEIKRAGAGAGGFPADRKRDRHRPEQKPEEQSARRPATSRSHDHPPGGRPATTEALGPEQSAEGEPDDQIAEGSDAGPGEASGSVKNSEERGAAGAAKNCERRPPANARPAHFSGSSGSMMEVGAAIELRRVEPGVRIEKKSRS